MRTIILFSISIILVSFLPALPSAIELLAVFGLSVLLVFKTKYYCFLSIPLGLIYATVVGNLLMAEQLPDTLDGIDVVVTGRVVGLPVTKVNTTKFSFIVNEAVSGDESSYADIGFLQQKKLSISYNTQYNHKYPMPLQSFVPGEQLQLFIKLRKPRGFVNPAGFDYHLHLLRHSFSATAYVKNSGLNRHLLDIYPPSLSVKRDQLRLRIRSFVEASTRNESHTAGALLALISGDKQLMSNEQWLLFKDTGTIHLMVISGLHIGLIAFLGFAITRVLVKTIAILLPQFVTSSGFFVNVLPSCLSIIFASIYAVIAGFGLPTQRALIMVFLFHVTYCLHSKSRPWFAFFTALAIVLILDPLAAHTAGFWLSFGAVGILLFSFKGFSIGEQRSLLKRTVAQWLKSQWVLLIGLGVPSIVLLGGVSVSGFLSNLIAIPVVSFVVVPLALLSAISLFIFEPAAVMLLGGAQASFSILLWYLTNVNDLLPDFYVYSNKLNTLVIIVSTIGTCYCLAPGITYRYIALLCFLPVIFVQQNSPFLRITFLDVGQGTAIVIETKRQQMVYDTGKKYSEQFDSGANIMAPYLLSLGYQSINTIMVSHGDGDHAGGLNGLSETIKADRLLVGEVEKTEGEQCLAGQHWQWDDVNFEVIWPTQEYVDAMQSRPVYYKSNNISCVLLIKAGSQAVLLAGDIDRFIEKRIADTLQKEQGIDIVLAPHHGSKTSSSQLWVDTLQAQFVVFTAGYRNHYGHPHASVVERYQKAGTRLLNTATDGAIRFNLNGDKQPWQLERWRYDYAYYWH